MRMIRTGQLVSDSGFYADEHGHLLLLRSGDPAPICIFSGPTAVRWRLVRPLPVPAPR